MKRRWRIGALGLAAAMTGLAACGGSSGAPTGTPTTTATNSTTSATPAVRTTAPEPGVAPRTTTPPAGVLITVGHQPEGIVADGPTDELAVAVRGPSPGDGVEILSLAQRKVIGFAPTTGAARHLQLAGPGGPVLVPAEGSDMLYRVSLGAPGTESNTSVGRQPHDATALAGKVLVTNELANTISVLLGTTVTATVPAPVEPGGIAGGTETDGTTPVALVVGVRARQVEALSPNGSGLGRATAGVGPTHVRFGNGHFYVADTSGNRILVYVVDATGPRQVGSVGTGGGAPYGLAVDPTRNRVWVTLTATNQLQEYRTAGDGLTLVQTFPTPRQPNDVTVDPATGMVAVAGTGADQVQVITP